MKKTSLLLSCLFFLSSLFTASDCRAQNVGINATGATPDTSAMLDILSSDKGILLPRVALTATNSALPVISPAISLLVYDTATAGVPPNDVTPGFYYWDGSQWVRLYTGTSGVTGPTGAAGTNGTNGATGSSGADGITGATGPIGVTGVTGPSGVDGITGATGPIGVTGTTGSNGVAGATGPTGADGALNAWSLTGNTGTTASTAAIGSTVNNNFLGTTDAIDFVLATNNLERLRITSAGSVGIGTSAPGNAGLTVDQTITSNTDYRAINSQTHYNGGSTMTNFYGRYIAAPAGTGTITNKYALVSEAAAGKVGIGMIAPATTLHSAGQVSIGIPSGGLGGASATTGSLRMYNSSNTNTVAIQSGVTSTSYTVTLPTAVAAGNNYALVSTTAGVLSWKNIAGGSIATNWAITGNAGTTASTSAIGATVNNNFTGTTDAIDFVLASDNLERMRISSSGNIGFNTIAPAAKVDIHFTAAGQAIYWGVGSVSEPTLTNGSHLVGRGTTSDYRIAIQDNNGRINHYWNSYYDGTANRYLTASEPVVRMAITTTGAGTIGAGGGVVGLYSAPAGNKDSTITWRQMANFTDSSNIQFTARNSLSDFSVNVSGNIGMGTAAPTNSLSFGGNAARTIWMERETTSNTAGNNLTLQSGGATSAATDKNGGDLTLSSGTATGTGASNLHFYTAKAQVSTNTTDNAPTEKMTVLGSGNVGIGTTSPAALLSVGSTSQFQVNSSGAIAAATGITSSGTITFSGLGSGLVKASGGVLSLATAGTDFQAVMSAGTGISISGNTINSVWTLSSNNIYNNNTANVGIAISTPVNTLDVNGSFGTNLVTTNSGSGAVTLDNTASVWYFSGAFTGSVSLPAAASGNLSRRYIIANTTASPLTVSNYTDLTGTSVTAVPAQASVEVISDGSNWLQIK